MSRDLFLEDVEPGQIWTGGPIAMTEDTIIKFAREFDPQPMHIDPAAAGAGRFGGIIASGWHVASLVMRDFVDRAPFGATPLLGLGIDQLKWPHPVRPGDVLSIRREVLSVVRSKSKPDRGVVTMQMVATNQKDEIVLSFVNAMQILSRDSAA